MLQPLIKVGFKKHFERFNLSGITNESLMFLYCLYHKWLKKLQKLKYLSNVLKDGFLMYVDAVVAQSTGTC